jgi:hypothetical protein
LSVLKGEGVDARPSDEEIARWHRWFAMDGNNRAWQIAELANRTPEDVQEMLHAAHAAAWHWSKVGTPLNTARSLMLLGHVHGLAGSASIALDYATSSLSYFTSRESPDWEVAFAHAVMASAARACPARPPPPRGGSSW